MPPRKRTVEKAYAYVTRDEGAELLVFEEAEKAGTQVPKGTVEPGEDPPTAVVRELREEAGLDAEAPDHVATDDWHHRSKPKVYRRHFFHLTVAEPRDGWTHVVTGDGADAGDVYDYRWRPVAAVDLADDMDAHLDVLPE